MLKQINACCLLAAAAVLAEARSAEARTHAAARTTPVTTVSAVKSGDRCPPAPLVACKVYQPCVMYKGSCCGSKVNQVLRVKDPCSCCCEIAEIPVCLPACCKRACVSSKCGLFGRGVVKYSYDCGVCVTIVFRRCGDVVVSYRG